MSRKVVSLLLLMLLVPAVSAGSADDPELSDASGDTGGGRTCDPSQTPGPICNAVDEGRTAFTGADLTVLWLSEIDDLSYMVHVQTAAAGDDTVELDLAFNVTPTDASEFGGEAEHRVFANFTGVTPDSDAPEGTTIVRNDTVLEITFTRAATGAVGADAITALAATTAHTTSSSAGPITATDTTTDETEGDSRPFVLSRIPVSASADVEIQDASLTQTINGTVETTEFAGGLVTTTPDDAVDATIQYTVAITNTGTDPDTFTLDVVDDAGTLADAGISTAADPADLTLDPSETGFFLLSANLASTPQGEYTLTVVARSAASAGIAGGDLTSISVPAAPAPPAPPVEDDPEPVVEEDPARTPVPAGLSFLSPVVEGMGLDGPFGDYAELVFLAIILLLLIVIIFLIIFLATRSVFTIVVEPRVLTVTPGQTATFDVQVRNKKGQAVDAVARFEGDPHWQTGIRFGEAEMDEQGVDGQLRFGPKDTDSAVRHGQLNVTAPADAAEKESDRVTLTVARLNDMGQPVKPKRTTVRVRTSAPTGGPVILHGVSHSPDSPAVGDDVRTTAVIENAEDHTMAVRVVLTVDGEDIQERSLLLPPGESTEVSFDWIVPSDSSKVRVRVFEQ